MEKLYNKYYIEEKKEEYYDYYKEVLKGYGIKEDIDK
jgi:hypothetical protein